jgi:hypothetical protein
MGFMQMSSKIPLFSACRQNVALLHYALVITSATANANNRCVQKVSKQERLFFMSICTIVDISAPGLSLTLLPHPHCG